MGSDGDRLADLQASLEEQQSALDVLEAEAETIATGNTEDDG